jgi:two-component system, NtrC family, sensor kinase
MVILKPTELHPEPSSEPALQHSAESLVAFVNHGPAVSWIQDAQLRFTFLSPQFEREFGLSRSVMVGATLFDLFPDAVAADIAERCRDVLDRGETVETVEHIPAHDGSTTTWLVCRFPLQNGSARLLGGIAFNITDRYRAEAALRETEERHRQILDAIADLVFVKGPQSQILWANKAFREMYGMSNEQLRGIVDAPFNEPDYTQKYIRDDAQVFSTGKALEIPEEHVTRHDGKILTVNTVKAPIVDASGNVVMMVGVSRDVTER